MLLMKWMLHITKAKITTMESAVKSHAPKKRLYANLFRLLLFISNMEPQIVGLDNQKLEDCVVNRKFSAVHSLHEVPNPF